MSLAYILDGGMNDEPGTGAEMYERYPAMRKVYEDVRDWTGYPPEQVIHEERPQGQLYRHGIGTIRQAAAVLGISDVLAEHGVTPSLICGLSSGALTAACLAGAIDREDFFGLLCRMREVPQPDPEGSPQGVCVMFIPAQEEPADHVRALSTDVYLGADCGVVGPDIRMIMVGGYRKDLEELATRVPEKAFQFVDGHCEAFHTPLQQYLSDYIEPFVGQVQFRDATVPVSSCMERATVTEAAEFASMFVRNPVTPVRVPYLQHGLTDHGATLALLVGPSQKGVYKRPTIPLVHVETPEHIVAALTAIHELDVPLPA
jgi:[acyl-carrier-protein] S-malonyltransferase